MGKRTNNKIKPSDPKSIEIQLLPLISLLLAFACASAGATYTLVTLASGDENKALRVRLETVKDSKAKADKDLARMTQLFLAKSSEKNDE